VGCWNEVDYFLSFAGKVGDFSFTATFSLGLSAIDSGET